MLVEPVLALCTKRLHLVLDMDDEVVPALPLLDTLLDKPLSPGASHLHH